MKRRYILAPEAARDLVQIWRYLKQESSEDTADRVESVIRSKIVTLASSPHMGHWRRDLTTAQVRFFLAYSYFIVYRPETKPLQVVSILHSRCDVAAILDKRLEGAPTAAKPFSGRSSRPPRNTSRIASHCEYEAIDACRLIQYFERRR